MMAEEKSAKKLLMILHDDAVDDLEYDGKRKKRRKLDFLDYQLPDRLTVSKYLEDMSLLSVADMAESMISAKEDGKSVTLGIYDTIKTAGFKRFDVKTMHATIIDKDKNRETFTSGCLPVPTYSFFSSLHIATLYVSSTTCISELR